MVRRRFVGVILINTAAVKDISAAAVSLPRAVALVIVQYWC